MDKVTRQCPQTTTFFELRERRAEAVSNRGPSAYKPNALPLGQTGSLFFYINKKSIYSSDVQIIKITKYDQICH